MAAKEPPVDNEEAMRRLVRFAFSDDNGDPDLSLLPEFAAALSKATRAAAERAWDEGYSAGRRDEYWHLVNLTHGATYQPASNPYRLPPKGDDNGR